MKRLFDFTLSAFGLLVTSPILLVFSYLVYRQDKNSPFYMGERVGYNFRPFKMVKLRSMIKNADKTGVDSTSANDMRITALGQKIRKYKLDELTQLWNVLIGEMSFVGPRPNVTREVKLYTIEENKLLSVRPGITDFASIVFSDEGDILKDSEDPDIDYHQLIRPWKSRLALFYIEKKSILLDVQLIFWTLLSAINRKKALRAVHNKLVRLNAPEELKKIVLRTEKLIPCPPPGTNQVVTSREI